MKKTILLMLFFTLTISCISVPATSYASGINVYIDGILVNFTYDTGFPFISSEGRTMVPLRATMEAFGATVEWDHSTQTAFVRKDTTTVRCIINNKTLYRNNVAFYNDAAAVINSGRTFLPIRAVLEAFGATVSWDGNVIITSPGADSIIYGIENNPSVTTNYWGHWQNALNYKANGMYREAINTINSISSEFIRTNNSSSNAMLYKHLGECYSALSDYEKASSCFKREAYYWSITPGMEQSRIDAKRRSNIIKPSAQMYIKTTDPAMSARTDFGKPLEPKGGIFLGAYAEGDTNIYNAYDPNKFYITTFPQLIGRDIAAYLLYLPYGSPLSTYQTHIEKAKATNKILQIALEPHQGLGAVNAYDGYLAKLATDMENSGCKLMLRFAGEMNDTTNQKWYSYDGTPFITAFRTVADIFHTYAPSVPVIWAPNHYPMDNILNYYPGDNYVDYVGISSYMMHQPVTDPINQGVDRNRWSKNLDTLYSLFGHKKPIMIVEGGASYMDYDTWADISSFAAYQIEDFYKYLPIKYPNVKMSFVFDSDRERQKFSLSNNGLYLEGYKKGIQSPLYNVYNGYSEYTYDYYEIGNNINVKAEYTEIASYVTTPLNDTCTVIYYINGEQKAVSYGTPFTANIDFTPYKGQQVTVTMTGINANSMQTINYSVRVNVI